MCAFAVALIGAIIAEKSAPEALAGALWALVAGEIAGLIAGSVLAASMRESMDEYRRARPIPSLDDAGAQGKRKKEG